MGMYVLEVTAVAWHGSMRWNMEDPGDETSDRLVFSETRNSLGAFLFVNGRDPWISPKSQVEAGEAGYLCSTCTCNINEFNGQGDRHTQSMPFKALLQRSTRITGASSIFAPQPCERERRLVRNRLIYTSLQEHCILIDTRHYNLKS